jgi:hypothetical protein
MRQTSTSTRPDLRSSHLVYVGASVLLSGLLALLGAACSIPAGERCLPDAYDDPCGAGFACTTPPNCLVSVCCPTPNQTIPAPDIPAGCTTCLVDTSGGGGGNGSGGNGAGGNGTGGNGTGGNGTGGNSTGGNGTGGAGGSHLDAGAD